jgi:amino acid transporter
MLEDHDLSADTAANTTFEAAAPRTAALPTMTYDDDMYGTEKSFGRGSQASDYYGEASVHRDGIGRRVIESFKRDPNFNMTPKGSLGADGKVFDVESAAQNTANSPLARKLKGRHLQMIAIGGSIGMLLPHVAASLSS